MSDELVFYTNPMSRGRIIRWMLEEVGQPYRTEILDFASLKSDAYVAVNPMAKVPAIRHREAVVTECGAICAYLADAFPQAGLAPAPGDRLRGPYYRWLFFTAGPLEAAVTDRSLGIEVPQDREAMVGYGSYKRAIDVLEKALDGREYVVGDRFTAADVYVGSFVNWGLNFGTVERRPALERYADRLAARPAAVRAREIDDALIPQQQPQSA